MKKFITFALLAVFLLSFAPSKSLANETLEENQVDTQSNMGSTTFVPEGSEEIQTYGLSFAGGTIGCYVMGKNAYCPWAIQVKGDVINSSKVVVTLKRDEGFLHGGYKTYSTFDFTHDIYNPSSSLRNEASWKLPAGHYKAYLGGSFSTVANGWYSAFASDPAVFEIE